MPFFWSQHYARPSYVGHAEHWDRLEIDGNPAAHDCAVSFWRAAGGSPWPPSGAISTACGRKSAFPNRRLARMTSRAAPASYIQLKRAYGLPSPEDGSRVLVDRLWPRGLRKADAAVDRWMKDIAPSTELKAVVWPRPGALAGVSLAATPQELKQHATAVDELRDLALDTARLRWCSARATKSTHDARRVARSPSAVVGRASTTV